MFDNREMMAISGHKSERVFEKYIKVGVSEQADRIYKKMKVLNGRKEKKVVPLHQLQKLLFMESRNIIGRDSEMAEL